MLEEIISQIDQKKAELDKTPRAFPESELKALQQLRVDINYHASHLKTNKLTWDDAKSLIFERKAIGGKPLLDHLLICLHDSALQLIERWASSKKRIDLQAIHKLYSILVFDPYDDPDVLGDYKSNGEEVINKMFKKSLNYVERSDTSIFYFSTPEQSKVQLQELIVWFNHQLDQPTMHPVLFAAEFHYSFLRIHPFEKANGRIAGLLMNYILMITGYPPAIIRAQQKKQYLQVLRQADEGALEPFGQFIAECVSISLEMFIAAAHGIEFSTNQKIELELSEIKKKLQEGKISSTLKTDKLLNMCIEINTIPLVFQLIEALKPIKAYFNEFQMFVYKNGGNSISLDVQSALHQMAQNAGSVNRITVSFHWKGLKSIENSLQTEWLSLDFMFDDYIHSLKTNFDKQIYEKEYNEYLNNIEMNTVIKYLSDEFKKYLNSKYNNIFS